MILVLFFCLKIMQFTLLTICTTTTTCDIIATYICMVRYTLTDQYKGIGYSS
jgi:hypothetical protein